jgi:hypothetical protein
MRKTGNWNAFRYDFDDLTKKLSAVHKEYKEAKTHAETWRGKFLESLATAKAKKNGTKVAIEWKTLTTVSKQCRQALKLEKLHTSTSSSAQHQALFPSGKVV